MRALLYLLVSGAILLSVACERQQSNLERYIGIDEELITEYLAENNIDAEKDPSGLYYVIKEEGEGEQPTAFSQVQVSYTAYFLDGTVFAEADTSNLDEFELRTLMAGWQIGLPLIKEGGEIQLFVPSRYGYDRNLLGPVPPPNTVSIFDIKLHRIR
jgi:FKBP-type peptidyl-prolyl cis-trans isomerase